MALARPSLFPQFLENPGAGDTPHIFPQFMGPFGDVPPPEPIPPEGGGSGGRDGHGAYIPARRPRKDAPSAVEFPENDSELLALVLAVLDIIEDDQ